MKGEMEREWGNEEEMEREWENGKRLTLYISTFSLIFPISKIVWICSKMLNTALSSRKSQTTYHTRYEQIILGRIHYESSTSCAGLQWHITYILHVQITLVYRVKRRKGPMWVWRGLSFIDCHYYQSTYRANDYNCTCLIEALVGAGRGEPVSGSFDLDIDL